MSPRRVLRRGTTLIEVLVAIALLLIIFLFITSDLIQSSQAENVSATRTESMNAANYLLGIMRTDNGFWGNGAVLDDWATGPGGSDPCGNPFPPYTDNINAPTWHPAPACTPSGSNPGLFPDMVGDQSFQYMWNAQDQPGSNGVAQLTVWVQVEEGGRTNVYELNSSRGNISAQPTNTPIKPPTPTPPATPTPSSGSPTPKQTTPPPTSTPKATPTPQPTGTGHGPPTSPPTTPPPTPPPTSTPKPTPTPTPKPTPTPQPSGTFE
jgi:prepilin-type N-terminal cleavage/methylation domain-containing protein